MTWNCQNPTANPLNTRCDGNYNVLAQELGLRSYFSRPQPGQELTVPVPKMFSQADLDARNASLQVPHQNQIPMGCENDQVYLDPDRYLTLADGTVMDLKTRKPLRQKPNDSGCWGSRKISWGRKEDSEKEWGDPMDWSSERETPEGRLSNDDLEYARISKVMNQRIKDEMSDEQKELLSNLDSILGSSKLEEE